MKSITTSVIFAVLAIGLISLAVLPAQQADAVPTAITLDTVDLNTATITFTQTAAGGETLVSAVVGGWTVDDNNAGTVVLSDSVFSFPTATTGSIAIGPDDLFDLVALDRTTAAWDIIIAGVAITSNAGAGGGFNTSVLAGAPTPDTTVPTFTADHTVATTVVLTYSENVTTGGVTDGTGFTLSTGNVTGNTNPAGNSNIITLTVNSEGTAPINVTYDNTTGPATQGDGIQAVSATVAADDNVETTITATTLTTTTTRVDFSEPVAGTFINGNWVVQAVINPVLSVQGAQTGITSMIITHDATANTNAVPTVTYTAGGPITDEGGQAVVFTSVASAAATDSAPPVVADINQTTLTNIDVVFDTNIDTVAATVTNGWSLTGAPGATVDGITDESGGGTTTLSLTVSGLTGASMPTVNYAGPTATTPIIDDAGTNAAVAAFVQGADDVTSPAISSVSYDEMTGVATIIWNETVTLASFILALDPGADFQFQDSVVTTVILGNVASGTVVNSTGDGLTMTLTLNASDQAGVNGLVAPITFSQTGTVVVDLANNNAAAQALITVALGSDTTPPVMESAITTDITHIFVTFGENLDFGTVATGDFAVAGNTVAGAIDGASAENIVELLLGSAIATDGIPSVSLTNTAGGIDDLAGNTNTSTSSVVPADGVAPTVVDVSTLTKNSFRANFSEPVTSTFTDWTGIDFVTGGTRNAVSVANSGTANIDVTFDGAPLVNTGDTQLADGTGLIRAAIDDLSGNTLATFANHAIIDGLIPEILSAVIDGANTATIIYSEISVTHAQADYTNLVVAGNAVNVDGLGTANVGTTTVASLAFDGPATSVDATGTVTVSFAGGVVDGSGNLLGQQNVTLTDEQVPSLVTAVVTGPNQVTLTFDEQVTTTAADYADLNMTLVGLVNITSVDTSANPVIVLNHIGNVATDETGTVNINATLEDTAGNALAPLVAQALTDGQKPVIDSASITDISTIVVNYSEAIVSTFNDYTNLNLTPGGIHVVTNANVNGAAVTLTFAPNDAALTATATMTVSANNLVADVTGNLLDTVTTQNVTAGQEPSFTAATVSNTTTLVTFSELVDGTIVLANWAIAGANPTNANPATGAQTNVATILFTHADSLDTAATPAVVYVPGDLEDQAGTPNALANLTTTAADGVPPTFTASTVDLNTLRVTFSENVNSATDVATQWTVAGHTVVGVTALDGTGATLDIDITGTPLADGAEDPDVAYTAGDIVDASPAANALVGATDSNVGDGIIPTILTAVISNGNEIVVTFSEINMTVVSDDFTSLVLNGNDGRNIDAGVLSVNNSIITLTFDGAASDPTSTGTMVASFADGIEDAATNKLGSTPVTITAGQQPFIDTIVTGPAANQITITYSENIDSPSNLDQAAAFTVTGGLTVTGAPDPASTDTVTLTLSGNLGAGDTPTVNYDATVGDLRDLATPTPIDVPTSSTVTTDGILPTFTASTQDLNTLLVTFTENVTSPGNLATQWAVTGHAIVGVSTLDGTGATMTIDITGTALADGAETPNVVYTAGDIVDTAATPNALATATDNTVGDGIFPVLMWAEISNTANRIVMTFNEPVFVTTGDDYTSFALNGNDFRNIASVVVGAGNIETLTFDGAAQNAGDVGTINVGVTGNITDDGLNVFVARTGVTVNPDQSPTLLSAQFTGGNEITLVFDEPVIATTASFTNLTLSTGGTPAVSAVDGNNTTTLVLTFDLNAVTGAVTGTVNVSVGGNEIMDLTEIAAKDVVLITAQVIAAGGAITAPVITSPEDGDLFADGAITVIGTYGTGTNSVDIVDTDGTTVLGSFTDDGSLAFSIDITLTDGAHTLTAQAIDGFGTTNSASINVTIDSTAPDAPVITSPIEGATLTSTTFDVVGTAEADSAIDVLGDATSVGTGTADGSGDFTISVTTSTGAIALTATATDAAGNVSDASTAVNVTVSGVTALPDRSYNNDLQTVFDSRPDLQQAFPEALTGDFTNLYGWAWQFGVNEAPSTLGQHEAMYSLLWVYHAFRPDLETAFPEAAFGADITGLLEWASLSGITEHANILADDEAVYNILWIVQNFRPDLATAFPEALNGDDLSNVWEWAALSGITEHANILADDEALIDIMWVYEAFRPDLHTVFPEANNAGGLVGLYDWAANFGVTEQASILSEHASEYAAGPP